MSDVVVLIDREQGGKARLAATGLTLHSAFTLSYILEVLVRHGHVSAEVAAKVQEFIAANQTDKAAAPAPAPVLPKRCAPPRAGGWGLGWGPLPRPGAWVLS